MHRVIYIDVLFCVNFIIDFMLLLSVKKFLSLGARYRRMLLGSAVGAVSSFVIFLPPLNELLSLGIRLLTAFAVVLSTFFPTSRTAFFKAAAAYFLISFCFCGACIAVLMLFSPPVSIRNGAVYIDISPLMLVGVIFICYIIIRLISRVSGGYVPKAELCRLTIENRGEKLTLIAKTDTGNMLREPFSNIPVIVAEKSSIEPLIPEELKEYALCGGAFPPIEPTNGMYACKLIPYNSVGGEGLLPAFKPELVTLSTDGGSVRAEAYIAVSGRKLSESFSAIVPSELIL